MYTGQEVNIGVVNRRYPLKNLALVAVIKSKREFAQMYTIFKFCTILTTCYRTINIHVHQAFI